jgi:hypothetical protein
MRHPPRPDRTDRTPPALRAYLAEFDALARSLPRGERRDLRASIWVRVADVAGPHQSDEAVRAAVSGLGAPAALVDAEAERVGRRCPGDWAAVHLLGASALTLGVGMVLGLLRLWRSPAWTPRDRAVGTLLVAAGPPVLLLATPLGVLPALLLGALALGPFAAACALALVRSAAQRSRS